MTADLQTAQQQRELAEHKLATAKATAEAATFEQALKLIESPQPVAVPWKEYPGYDDWGMGGVRRPYMWTSPDDRSEGRYLPLYENAHDVRRMRAESRAMAELFPVVGGAYQKLSDYIIGNGWDFTVAPKKRFKDDPAAIQLAKSVQALVDGLLEYNNFVGGMDREIHEQSRIDGVTYPTLYQEDRSVRIELTDPGCILEPVNKKPLERMCGTGHVLNGWWHGVHTVFNRQLRRDDVSRPLGYHAVFDRQGEFWDYFPASRVEAINRNVGSLARVGVPDSQGICEVAEEEGKIRHNTAVGTAILSAIVMIRQHAPGVTRGTIENMVSTNATQTYNRPTPNGDRTTNVEGVRPGTVKDTPAGMETTLGALGQLRQPLYLEVGKYLLAQIGQKWSMAYFILAGDSSESNYASHLVGESPFVKYCEHEQGLYGASFVRLIWKALRMLAKAGVLCGVPWEHVRAMLDIEPQYTSPASRDKHQQAQANQILVDMGVMSKRSAASDAGLDYDEEKAQIDVEPKPEPPPLLAPGGFGGGRFGESVDAPRLQALAEIALRSVGGGA